MNIKSKGLGLAGCFMTLLYFINPAGVWAQEIPSSESFLKKYTLTESFEVGMEFAYMIPNSGRTNNMGNAYLTLTHSTNTNSSYKFKTGLLNGEYLLYNQNLGRVYFVPLLTSFISSVDIEWLENPKPYYGFGVGYYFFENFKSAQRQYRKYEAENTYGYHFLLGGKWISESGILIRGEMIYETIKPFRFFNSDYGVNGTRNVRRVDFSNIGLTVNAALYF
ncbi:MAG: hypothetical protein HZA49_00720 [Planctomycetes bacterium]|nr:hypothetical protein [Planctomycetota bacterium]